MLRAMIALLLLIGKKMFGKRLEVNIIQNGVSTYELAAIIYGAYT